MSKLSFFQNINANMSPALIAAIHDTIEENKRYAIVIWKSRADDALDATLHHAMKYYSWDKGELRNYIVSTMKNILTNSLKKESSMDDEILHYHVDSGQEDIDSDIDIMIEESSDEVGECIQRFLPSIVSDYEFFLTLKKNKMQGNYSDILGDYSASTIINALNEIQRSYLPHLEQFMGYSQPLNNTLSKDSLATLSVMYPSSIELVGVLDGVALVKGYSPKVLQKINLTAIADLIVSTKYNDPNLKVNFFGQDYYKSPVGGIFEGKEQLILSLKEHLLYFLCKRMNFQVVGFDGDDCYLLGSPNEISFPVYSSLFNFHLVEVNRKEV